MIDNLRMLGLAEASDHSNHETVVEYAVRFLFKRKGPSAAAKATAKALSGSTNMVIGGGREVVIIEPKKLEKALWDRLLKKVIENTKSFRAGKEDFAFGAVQDHFRLGKRDSAKLKKMVEKNLGRPLWTTGTTPPVFGE